MEQNMSDNFKIIEKDEIINNPKYKPIDLKENTGRINELFQQIPGIIESGRLAKAYIMKIPDGLQGELVHLKQGGYSSVLYNDGKITGTASLYSMKLDAIFMSAFSVLSIATGQFFLSNINRQLREINGKLTEILDFLYSDKLCELEAEYEFLRYAYENYSDIMNSDTQRIATLCNIQNIKKSVYKDVLFFEKKITALFENDLSKKRSDVEKMYCDYFSFREKLKYSLTLYCSSFILEIFYAQDFSKKYLNWVKENMQKVLTECQGIMDKSEGKMDNCLKGCKRLDEMIYTDSDDSFGKTLRKVTREKLSEKAKIFSTVELNSYLEMLSNIEKKYNCSSEIAWCDGKLYMLEI